MTPTGVLSPREVPPTKISTKSTLSSVSTVLICMHNNQLIVSYQPMLVPWTLLSGKSPTENDWELSCLITRLTVLQALSLLKFWWCQPCFHWWHQSCRNDIRLCRQCLVPPFFSMVGANSRRNEKCEIHTKMFGASHACKKDIISYVIRKKSPFVWKWVFYWNSKPAISVKLKRGVVFVQNPRKGAPRGCKFQLGYDHGRTHWLGLAGPGTNLWHHANIRFSLSIRSFN